MSDEARMLGEMARGVLGGVETQAGTDPWTPMLEGGWIGVGIDEARGGAGGTLAEAAALAEAAGAVASAVPVAEAIAAAIVVAAADDTVLLGELVAGTRRAVLGRALAASADDDGDGDGDGVTLSTDGWSVAYPAQITDIVVPVITASGGARVAVVGVDALSLLPGTNVAGEPRAAIAPATVQVRAHPIAGDWRALEAAPALLGAARLVGAMRTAQTMSVAYANNRRQFGRTIGSFQAVAHALAAQVRELEQASAAVEMAVHGHGHPTLSYAARVIAARAARPTAEIAHQVHGAIGTTHEHDLHRFSMRLLAWRLELGAPRAWSMRLADALVTDERSWWRPFDAAAASRTDTVTA